MDIKKIQYSDWFIILSLFITCLFILLQSPLAPFAKSINGVDSSVFIYSAQQIIDGELIYKGIIDHKGPFLYFINVLALIIFDGNWVGIWFFELISLFITSLVLYKTVRLFSGRFISTISVISGLLFLIPLLIGGNFTEEWALPYMSIAQYVFLSSFKNNNVFSKQQLFILAITFVLTFMLRANLVALWTGYGIIIILKWIKEKKYRTLFSSVGWVIVYIIILLIPFIMYFLLKNTLSDAFYCVFKYNLIEYDENVGFSLKLMKASVDTLTGNRILSIIHFFPILILFFMDKKNFTMYVSIISAFIVSAMSANIGISAQHYFIIFIPLIVLSFCCMFNLINILVSDKKNFILFSIILFLSFNYHNIGVQIYYIYKNYFSPSEFSFYATLSVNDMNFIKEIIQKNTSNEDKILINGNQTSIYLYSGRKSASRFPFALRNSSLGKQYYVKEAENAKIIIQGNLVNEWDSFDLSHLLKERYHKLPINKDNIEIWILNDNVD